MTNKTNFRLFTYKTKVKKEKTMVTGWGNKGGNVDLNKLSEKIKLSKKN